MPGIDGIELVRRLAERKNPLPVVLISGHADIPMAVAGIKAGAEEFIEKPIDDAQLVAAINRGLAHFHENRGRSHEELQDRFSRLTPRQTEIFDLVADGLTSQKIAIRLVSASGPSKATVRKSWRRCRRTAWPSSSGWQSGSVASLRRTTDRFPRIHLIARAH